MNVHDKAIKIIKHIKPQTQSDYLFNVLCNKNGSTSIYFLTCLKEKHLWISVVNWTSCSVCVCACGVLFLVGRWIRHY